MREPPLLWLFNNVTNIYIWVMIIGAVLSILIQFGVVNRHQPLVQQIGIFVYRLTEPLYRKIRKYVPAINGIDLSPLVAIIGIQFIAYCVNYYLAPMFY